MPKKTQKSRFMEFNKEGKVNSDVDEVQKNKIAEENLDSFKEHNWRCLIFSHKLDERVFKRHLMLVYRGLIYSKKCLKSPSEKFLFSKQVNLCKSKGKKLILKRIFF